MTENADLPRAVLYTVSGGLLVAAFGMLGAAQAHAEPKNTAGQPSTTQSNGSSANAAEHHTETAERKKREATSGSERAAEHRRETAERKEKEATEEGSKKPSGSSTAAERRRENADRDAEAERRKANSAQTGRNEQHERDARQRRWENASDENRKEAEKARKRRKEIERQAEHENIRRAAEKKEREARAVSATRDYDEALKGGNPGSGMQRQVDNAQHKAEKLAAEAAKPEADAATRERAAAAHDEVQRLERKRVEQNARQSRRNQLAAAERARAAQEQQRITAGMHQYAEDQRGGNPGSAAARARREEQLRIAQGQLDYDDAIAGKPVGRRTAEIVERTADGRTRVTNARTGQSVVADMPLSGYVHPAQSLPVDVKEVVHGAVMTHRETLDVRDWQKLPDGRHPDVSVGSAPDGSLVAVSTGKLPQEVHDQLRTGWHVQSGTAEDGRKVTIFHPRGQYQTNVEDLVRQWHDVADKGPGKLGEALDGTGAIALDTFGGLGMTNVYGTRKDCLGSGRNCDSYHEEAAWALVGVTPLKGGGAIARGAKAALLGGEAAAHGAELAGRAALPRALAKTTTETAPRLPRIPRPPFDPGTDDGDDRDQGRPTQPGAPGAPAPVGPGVPGQPGSSPGSVPDPVRPGQPGPSPESVPDFVRPGSPDTLPDPEHPDLPRRLPEHPTTARPAPNRMPAAPGPGHDEEREPTGSRASGPRSEDTERGNRERSEDTERGSRDRSEDPAAGSPEGADEEPPPGAMPYHDGESDFRPIPVVHDGLPLGPPAWTRAETQHPASDPEVVRGFQHSPRAVKWEIKEPQRTDAPDSNVVKYELGAVTGAQEASWFGGKLKWNKKTTVEGSAGAGATYGLVTQPRGGEFQQNDNGWSAEASAKAAIAKKASLQFDSGQAGWVRFWSKGDGFVGAEVKATAKSNRKMLMLVADLLAGAKVGFRTGVEVGGVGASGSVELLTGFGGQLKFGLEQGPDGVLRLIGYFGVSAGLGGAAGFDLTYVPAVAERTAIQVSELLFHPVPPSTGERADGGHRTTAEKRSVPVKKPNKGKGRPRRKG